MQTRLPAIVIGYDRPDSLSICLEQMKRLGFQTVLVSIDGPQCPKNVKAVQQAVDVATSYQDKFLNFKLKKNILNKGLKRNMMESVSWFFQTVDAEIGIVVEDDVILTKIACDFAEMHEPSLKSGFIGHVSLYSPFKEKTPKDNAKNLEAMSMQTSRCFVWGFVTSRAAWKKYIVGEKLLEKQISKSNFSHSFPGFTWVRKKELCSSRFQKSWAIRWDTFNRINFEKSLCPTVALVKNIGVGDVRGTHTSYKKFRLFGVTHWIENLAFRSDFLFEAIRFFLLLVRRGR